MSAASTSPAPTSAPPSEALPTAEQHGIKEHSDGRFGFVPVQTRSARFKSFEVTDFPAVTGREAVWKLSPVAKFTDLTAGELDGSVYETLVTPHPDVDVSWVDRTDPRIGSAGAPEERAAANAWTSFERALAITVTGEDAKEITLTRANLGTGPRAAHTIIEAKPFSRAVVILQNTGDARITENIEIILGDSANLTVVTVQEWNDDAVQLANHFGSVGRDARLKHVVVSLGGGIIRVNPSVHLAGPGSDTELFGLYFADSGQHLEQQVYVNHDAPNSRSRVNYKGALQALLEGG
jgi:Fe-S cluster assembly protein SufD